MYNTMCAPFNRCFTALLRSKRIPAFSRHDAPELLHNAPSNEESGATLKGGRREDRVRAAPAVSCASCTKENAHEHTGSAEAVRPSLRNGFTASFVLSPVIWHCCHRRRRDAKNTPGIIANLTPALRRQDHTTSPYASARLRPKASPGLASLVRACETRDDAATSTASRPAFRDDREPPLLGDGMRFIGD
jgi:hypothetical protein